MQEFSDDHMAQTRECAHAVMDHMIDAAKLNGHKPIEIALEMLLLISVNLMAAGVKPQILTDTLKLARKHAEAFHRETLN
jgi:hypothetical protein